MKLYKKSDLLSRHGLIISRDGDVVAIDNEIVDLANELETKFQAAMYLKDQPDPIPERSLEGFSRDHMEATNIEIQIETPLMDAEVAKSFALMDEVDSASIREDANKLLANFHPLVEFVLSDEVLGIDGQISQHKFDTPLLGNPLLIDGDAIVNAAIVVSQVEHNNYDDIEVNCVDGDELSFSELMTMKYGKGEMEIDPSNGVDPYEQEQTEGNES